MAIALKCLVLFISLLVTVNSAPKITQGAIAFPESEENINLLNKQNRLPVYIPSTCPNNELLYPGDQADDWICDCRPGHLYHPKTDFCWPAFRKGLCREGEYLILPSKSVMPVCVPNPCVVDNLVMWNDRCEVLGSQGPCSNQFPRAALWVNATSLTIECVPFNINEKQAVDNRMGPNPAIQCPPGCKRSLQNKC